MAGKRAVIIEEANETQKRVVKAALPDNYNRDSDSDPVAVCVKCLRRAMKRREYAQSPEAATFYNQRRRECSEERRCYLCVTVTDNRGMIKITEQTEAAREQADIDAATEERRLSGAGRPRQQAGIGTERIMMVASRLRMSNRSARDVAAMLRASGIATAPGKNLLISAQLLVSTLFDRLFDIKPSPLCKDTGYYTVCNDVVAFIELVVYLVGKAVYEVEYVKFNCDQGQGTLKLMVQPLFIGMNDCLGSSNVKETSVLNTFIIVNADNCKETIETVRLMFDSVDLMGVDVRFKNAKLVFPNDLKMSNSVLGIGPNSSRYPTVYSLFSQNMEVSRPNTLRTVEGVIKDFKMLTEARRHEEDECAEAIAQGRKRRPKKILDMNFNSVVAAPIKYLQQAKPSIISTLIIPPLHLNIGIGTWCCSKLNIISQQLLLQFLHTAGLRTDTTRANLSMTGNDTRMMFRKAYYLMQLLPQNVRVPLSTAQDKHRVKTMVQQEVKLLRAKKIIALHEKRKRAVSESVEKNKRPTGRKKINKGYVANEEDEESNMLDEGEPNAVVEQLREEKAKAIADNDSSAVDVEMKSERLLSYQMSLKTSWKTAISTSPRTVRQARLTVEQSTPPATKIQPRRRKKRRAEIVAPFTVALRRRREQQQAAPTVAEMSEMLVNEEKFAEISAMPSLLQDGTLDVQKPVSLTEDQQSLVRMLAIVMSRYDAVITITQGKKLGGNFEETINAFGAAYKEFCSAYFQWKPRGAANAFRSHETPKIHIILNDMVRYLKLSRIGMSRLSEQNFESVHSRFKTFTVQQRLPRSKHLTATLPRGEQRYSLLARARATPPTIPSTDTALSSTRPRARITPPPSIFEF